MTQFFRQPIVTLNDAVSAVTREKRTAYNTLSTPFRNRTLAAAGRVLEEEVYRPRIEAALFEGDADR